MRNITRAMSYGRVNHELGTMYTPNIVTHKSRRYFSLRWRLKEERIEKLLRGRSRAPGGIYIYIYSYLCISQFQTWPSPLHGTFALHGVPRGRVSAPGSNIVLAFQNPPFKSLTQAETAKDCGSECFSWFAFGIQIVHWIMDEFEGGNVEFVRDG